MDRFHPLRVQEFQGQRRISGFVEGVSRDHSHDALRSWTYWLDDGGKIQIGLHGSDNYAEVRIRRWKTKLDQAVFQYRNSDCTRKYFDGVKTTFEDAGIGFEISRTPTKKRPRALEVSADPNDPFAPTVILNLVELAFGLSAGNPVRLDLSCSGALRENAANPPVRLFLPPELRDQSLTYEFGFRVGELAGRISRWIKGE